MSTDRYRALRQQGHRLVDAIVEAVHREDRARDRSSRYAELASDERDRRRHLTHQLLRALAGEETPRVCRSYPEQVRMGLVAQVKRGTPVATVARRAGVPRSTLGRRVREAGEERGGDTREGEE